MFTLADHFFQMEQVGKAEDPFLEGYTSLGFLAGQTETITLTLMVTGVTYRYPGLLAKTIATLDVLSRGRSMFAIGAAWYEREHLALGVTYPPLRQRFEMLEETVQICQQMWSDNDGPYQGRHYQLAETICQPQPINRPPVLIGGDGEKKTLRLVAQYADVWNSNAATPDEVKHKVEVLKRHCEEIGRDPREIRKTLMLGPQFDPFGDPTAFMNAMQGFAEAGIELINIAALPGNPDPIGFVGRLGDEVIPKLALLA
ncbi:LLM class F420-dependent oxidoreductase [Mycobacterium sp. E1747]|uniref:LLM class F420-dependent oxidoreductase n=1 Tax=Mycobacterium sp. E1747 TaxID=1834128 RepID=UPI00080017EE|nr:LLM class F420-dependent oxidoreductase [Mycobacterium sp. E1747]OBH10146.1 LLM class F420-dependent oxidoreductase [Mycobacterium sp. E1747]